MTSNETPDSELAVLTDGELDEIEARAVARVEIQAVPEKAVLAALIDNLRKDIPHLVAEIRRLRAENARLRLDGESSPNSVREDGRA